MGFCVDILFIVLYPHAASQGDPGGLVQHSVCVIILRLSGCYPAALEAGVSLWEDTRRGLECGVAPLALGSSVATLLAVLL